MGRRSSKTTLAALLGVYNAVVEDYRGFLRPGERRYILTVATSERQSAICLDMMRQFVLNAPTLAPLLLSDADGELTLSTGAVLRSMACNARSIRGLPVTMLILDELAWFISETEGPQAGTRVFQALSPSVAQFGSRGHILCTSTPNGRSGIFWQLIERATSGAHPGLRHWRRTTAQMNPTISA